MTSRLIEKTKQWNIDKSTIYAFPNCFDEIVSTNLPRDGR